MCPPVLIQHWESGSEPRRKLICVSGRITRASFPMEDDLSCMVRWRFNWLSYCINTLQHTHALLTKPVHTCMYIHHGRIHAYHAHVFKSHLEELMVGMVENTAGNVFPCPSLAFKEQINTKSLYSRKRGQYHCSTCVHVPTGDVRAAVWQLMEPAISTTITLCLMWLHVK